LLVGEIHVVNGLCMLLGFSYDLVDAFASQHRAAWTFDELTYHLLPLVCDDTAMLLQEGW
jgi:hypothetical protein